MKRQWDLRAIQDLLYLVIGVIAWTWMILSGIAAPDAFATILAAIAGALAGIITPLSAPGSRDGQRTNE
jgi:Na+/H+ antiporter NhaA